MRQFTQADIIQLIRSSKVAATAQHFSTEIPLREQGLDSLDVFDLFLAIEETQGIHVEDEQVEQLKTIDEIVTYLNQACRAAA